MYMYMYVNDPGSEWGYGGVAPNSCYGEALSGCYAHMLAKRSLTFIRTCTIMEFLGCGRLTNAKLWSLLPPLYIPVFLAAKNCPQIVASSLYILVHDLLTYNSCLVLPCVLSREHHSYSHGIKS